MISLTWPMIELLAVCFALILIIILTVGGNLVVLFAFYIEPQLLTPSNHFLLSMAIADLFVGLIAMPFYSYAQIKNTWPFGKLFCKIWLTIDDVATMASVLSIVAITIERYWSINHSVHYRRHTTKTRIRIFSILIWLIPLLNFAPGIWLLDSPDDMHISINSTKKNYSECIGAYHSYTSYLIIAQINFFAWPLVVILILNILIVLNLYRRSRYFPNFDSSHGKSRMKTKSKDTIAEQKNDDQHPQIIENYQVTRSQGNKNKSSVMKNKDFQCHHENAIASIIKEGDEQIIEDDSCPTRSPQTVRIQRTKSTSKFQQHFKQIFQKNTTISSSQSSISSKSTKQHKRRSIFVWRNSSVNLPRKSTNNGEQHRTNRRLRRDKRAATSLLTLVLVFMIFLLPYVVVVVVGNLFSVDFLIDTNGQVYSAAFWLLWLNSTVNPILYPFIQPKFRDAYRKIFLRLTRRRRRLASLINDVQREK